MLHFLYMFGGLRFDVLKKHHKFFSFFFLFFILFTVPSFAFTQSISEISASGSSLFGFISSMIASFVNMIGNMIGSLTITLIDAILLNILTYNNFSESSIVTLGWILTRDIVNMAAVIALLVLAVKSILGDGIAAWQQHLPKFFLGIVFANFSRTLCGLAVDASQIVMMTFVNALLSIGPGNFAQLMVLPEATKYSAETVQKFTLEGVGALTLAANLANAYAKLLVQVTVMCVIGLLAVAFLWRIVILWIAFIMAPLAAFSWGTMDFIKWFGRVWNEWLQQFLPPLILGPMLTFFLYLALAVSSNANLAESQGFTMKEEQTTYGNLTLEIFQGTNFTGMMLAVVFLLLGISESAKIASKMGGLAAMAINEKMGNRAFRVGAWVAGGTVGNVAKISARTGLKTAAVLGRIGDLGGQALADKLQTSSPNLAWMARGAGGTLGGIGRGADVIDEQVRLIPKNVMDMKDYAKNRAGKAAEVGSELARKMGKTEHEWIEGGRAWADEFGGKGVDKLGDLLGAGQGSRDVAKAVLRNINKNVSTVAKNAPFIGTNELEKAGSFLGGQAHHISEEEKKAAKERVSHMTDEEKVLRMRQFFDDTGEKSIEAFANAEHLSSVIFSDKRMETLYKKSVGDARFTTDVQKVLEQFNHEDEAGHLSLDRDKWNKLRSRFAHLYLNAGHGEEHPGKVEKFINSADFSVADLEVDALKNAEIFKMLANATTGKRRADGKNVTKLDVIRDGDAGSGERARKLRDQARDFTAESFKVEDFSTDIPREYVGTPFEDERRKQRQIEVDKYLQALSRTDGDPKKMSQEVLQQIQNQLREIETDTERKKRFSQADLAAIHDRLAMQRGENEVNDKRAQVESYLGGKIAGDTAEQRTKIRDIMKEDLTILQAFDNALKDQATQEDVSSAVFDNLSAELFKKMKEMRADGLRTNKEVEDALKNIEIVLDRFEEKARNGITEKQLQDATKAIQIEAAKMPALTNPAERLKLQQDIDALQAKRDAMAKQMDQKLIDKVRDLRTEHKIASRY